MNHEHGTIVMSNNKMLQNEEDQKVFTKWRVNLYLALLAQVNPSLRAICIYWKPGDEEAILRFFHDGDLTENMQMYYEDIEFEAWPEYYTKWKEEIIQVKFEIVSLPFPAPIPQAFEVVFFRKEVGAPITEINTFYPRNWDFVFCILLKVNEALCGRVTKDLRSVYLKWNLSFDEATITFIHNSEITQVVYNDYQEIFKIATSMKWITKDGKEVIPKLEVISTPYPKEISYPKESHLLYARKEPFIDPVEE